MRAETLNTQMVADFNIREGIATVSSPILLSSRTVGRDIPDAPHTGMAIPQPNGTTKRPCHSERAQRVEESVLSKSDKKTAPSPPLRSAQDDKGRVVIAMAPPQN